jgi:hypothetical protein
MPAPIGPWNAHKPWNTMHRYQCRDKQPRIASRCKLVA